jgi:hypothetical protein
MGIHINLSHAIKKVTGGVKKLEKKAEANIKKAAGKVEGDLRKATKGIKKLGKNLLAVGGFAPLLPYYGLMKKALKKRGISYKDNIQDVAFKFYHNVVMNNSNYEGDTYEGDSYDANTTYAGGVDVPVYPSASYVYNDFDPGVDTYSYDLQYNVDGDPSEGFGDQAAADNALAMQQAATLENPAAGKGFDNQNLAGKLGGAAGGAALGLPPAVGAATGGAIEGIVKGIVKFFGNLIKAKKEGKLKGEQAAMANEALSELAKTTADEAAVMSGAAEASSTDVGTFVENNKTMLIVVVVVILAVVGFMVFRKK